MVVEGFGRGAAPVYQRSAEQGRLLPTGLKYVDSWIDQRLDRWFQLMEADDPRVLESGPHAGATSWNVQGHRVLGTATAVRRKRRAAVSR
jgi:hypothetical protein